MRRLSTLASALAGIVLLPLTSTAQHPDDHQHTHEQEMASGSERPDPYARDWVVVSDDPEAGELTFLVGPVNLPAESHHDAVEQPPLITVTVPRAGYLYGFDVQMEDGQGNPISNAPLHHINLIDPDHRELFSPVARRLFAAGRETKRAGMPKQLGVPLGEGQRLLVSAMFHNPSSESYPEAHLRVILMYRTDGWFFPVEVHPVYIDVMGHIGEKDFDLPPGEYERSWQGSPAISGRILGAGGHVHEHATALRFEDLTTGEVLWETGPVLDEEGKLVTVPVGKFWWKGGLKLHADHEYRLTAAYDNPTGETIIDGGMGVLGGIFLPARGEAWPELDAEDPDYVTNMEKTRMTAEMRALGMASGHGHH